MAVFTGVFRAIFDWLLGPFGSLPALVTLLPISLAFSILALYAFKWTSDQEALRAVKRQIYAGILEVRLFKDDLRTLLSAQLTILGQVFRQVRLSVTPLLWMLLPAYILFSHLNSYYAYGGFQPGDEFLVKATLSGEPHAFDAARPDYTLQTSSGVSVEAGPLWIPSLNELTWRVRARDQGSYELQIVAGDGTSTSKHVQVSDRIVRRSETRSATLTGQLWNPAEAPLRGDAPFREIAVDYPQQDVSFFGIDLNWIIVFLIVSFLFALVLRGSVGVTF